MTLARKNQLQRSNRSWNRIRDIQSVISFSSKVRFSLFPCSGYVFLSVEPGDKGLLGNNEGWPGMLNALSYVESVRRSSVELQSAFWAAELNSWPQYNQREDSGPYVTLSMTCFSSQRVSCYHCFISPGVICFYFLIYYLQNNFYREYNYFLSRFFP